MAQFSQSNINQGDILEKEGTRYRVEDTTSDHVTLSSMSDNSTQKLSWSELTDYSKSSSAT